MLLKVLILLIVGFLISVLSSLGLPAWFRHAYFEYHAHVRLRFKLAAGLGEPWTRDGGIPQGCPLSMMFIVALYLPWCRYLSAQVGVQPQLYADNLKCVSRNPGPASGLVLGRGVIRVRTVRLGGPIVRSVRRSSACDGDVDDVSLYRDSSAAPVLDLRRNLRAILDLLDSIIKWGASLARDVQLLHLWDSVVRLGSLGSVHVHEYEAARVCGVCESRRIVAELHGRVSTFVKGLVAYRRNVGITAWRNWLREDPLVHPYGWLRADLVPPSPFLQCSRALTPGGSGVLADPARIDEEFRKALASLLLSFWTKGDQP